MERAIKDIPEKERFEICYKNMVQIFYHFPCPHEPTMTCEGCNRKATCDLINKLLYNMHQYVKED